MIHNYSKEAIQLEQNKVIGWLENITNFEVGELITEYIPKLAAFLKEKRERPRSQKEKCIAKKNLQC